MKNFKIILSVLIIFGATLSFWIGTRPLALKELSFANVLSILGSLFIIALILERALDVFLTTWRAGTSEKLDLDISSITKTISNFEKLDDNSKLEKKEIFDQLRVKREQKLEDKLEYRANTRLIALWLGLALGILISSIGVRFIRSLIDPLSFNEMSAVQENVFNFIDVLLTGGLLAGGSDGIHKIIDLYRVFMETSAKKSKENIN